MTQSSTLGVIVATGNSNNKIRKSEKSNELELPCQRKTEKIIYFPNIDIVNYFHNIAFLLSIAGIVVWISEGVKFD